MTVNTTVVVCKNYIYIYSKRFLKAFVALNPENDSFFCAEELHNLPVGCMIITVWKYSGKDETVMKKIIVTGCNGQLGRAVNQQYAGSTEYELVNTDVGELDITNVDKVLISSYSGFPAYNSLIARPNCPFAPVTITFFILPSRLLFLC